MRIGIVTFYESSDNYGEQLQCFALQRFLLSIGHNPFLIRYGFESTYFHWLKKRNFTSWKGAKLMFSHVMSALISTMDDPRGFKAFRKKHIKVSPRCYNNIYELRRNPPKADCYIVGSDQVWAQLLSIENNKTFFLDFGSPSISRIAYAPSFAMSEYPIDLRDALRVQLAKFDALSVRERSGVQICQDLGYRELFVRWYQWGAFLPVFRGHGTDCRRELWHYENAGQPFYDALLAANRLRYELIPYIYSYVGLCWLENQSVIRLLAFEWPEDKEVWNITDQYLFGKEMMVCPVLKPMYFEKNSEPLEGTAKTRRVYLPAGCGWYDYWTNAYYEGGQWIEAEAGLEKIPLFVREGSILPRVEFAQSTEETGTELHITVYTGKDASFTLYEDAGDGYGYEQGRYCLTKLHWSQETERFTAESGEEMGQMLGFRGKYEVQEVKLVNKETD